ncbi:MAG: cytochrome c [Gemmatimonadetes bacterium]|nr:cytochrome c [Gemmatimonadota bacterium]
MFVSVVLFAALANPAPADTGAVLYAKWCSSCHGADGRGVSKTMTRLEVPAADLANCRISSAEPEEQWTGIVRDGGEAYGLSLDMPSFGDGASADQITWVVRYLKSLCTDPAWPPGELNFPRAVYSEKAFPENEVVLVAEGREQSLIYERRIGPRFQLEGVVRTVLDGGDVFGGITAAAKYNLWHSLPRLMIASVGLELTPALGRQAEWEIEPFLSFGANPGGVTPVQAEVLATIEDGFAGATVNFGAGREIGRFVPMLEASWAIPRVGPQELTLAPQLWVQLSRLGHVAASIGIEVPVAGPSRDARLVAFVLWDFADGALTAGW